MKTTGTPCRKCVHHGKQTWEQPCCWCISDEDIVLAHINPEHPVDFTRFEMPKDSISCSAKKGV